MNTDYVNSVDLELLFLLREMNLGKNNSPYRNELVKTKSIFKKVMNVDADKNKTDRVGNLYASGHFGDEKSLVKNVDDSNLKGTYNHLEPRIKYVFHEATLFFSMVLKSIISDFVNNKWNGDFEQKEGEKIPIELSVIYWYSGLLEEVYDKNWVGASFFEKHHEKLYKYKSEFERKRIDTSTDVAINDFKSIMSEISESERRKFSEIAKTTMDSIVGYYQKIQETAIFELDRLKSEINQINEIKNGNEVYKNKIEMLHQHCEKRKASIDEVFFASKKQGMAKSFQDMAIELQSSIRIWLGVFILSLAIVAWNGYLLNENVNLQLQSGSMKAGDRESDVKAEARSVENTGNISVSSDRYTDSRDDFLSLKAMGVRVLMMAPFLWLAWFSGRQYSHCNKLRQDYIYKGAIAMAYQGYKEESTEVGSDMHNKLLENIVVHFSDNPVRLYEKSESTSPLEDLFKKLSPEGVAELIKALKAK